MNAWKANEVFFDTETRLYGIGQGNGLSYEPQFTEIQARTVLNMHRRGVQTFERILFLLKKRGIDFENMTDGAA